MQVANVIALISVCVAGLSALYARRSNQITVQNALRHDRHAVFTALVDFLHFCATYSTRKSNNNVKGTNDLVTRLDRFNWEVARLGPLDMPEVEKVLKETTARAWQLQRTLDRLGEPADQRTGSDYIAEEDKLNSLVDWFASREKGAETVFEQYLKSTQ